MSYFILYDYIILILYYIIPPRGAGGGRGWLREGSVPSREAASPSEWPGGVLPPWSHSLRKGGSAGSWAKARPSSAPPWLAPRFPLTLPPIPWYPRGLGSRVWEWGPLPGLSRCVGNRVGWALWAPHPAVVAVLGEIPGV